MGYYSQMECGNIKTDLKSGEIKKISRKIENELNDYDKGYFKIYSLKRISRKEYQVLVYGTDDYNVKHYGDVTLAYFISQIINKNSVFELTFTGEDGNYWGYEISRNHIMLMEKLWHKTNTLTIKEFKHLYLNLKKEK